MMASADAVEIDGIYYNLVSKVKTAEVTVNPNGYSGEVVIPQVVTYDGNEYSVISIDEFAFSYDLSLTSVTIPNSVTSIGDYAFNGCWELTSVNIPNSVTSLGSSVFCYCTRLTSVDIPNSVTSIGVCAFQGCKVLTSVSIPNSVTSISSWAFKECSGLTSVVIPNSVTFIGEGAFMSCSGLTSIIIGSGLGKIVKDTFADCPELTDVYCYAENVPNTSSDTFEGSYIEHATLHVPNACSDAYKSVEPWKNFKSIVEISKYNLTYIVDGEEYKKYEIEEGKPITPEAEPTKEHYTFSGWSEIPEVMPANDFTVTGTFAINKHKLDYKVDGNDYKSYDVEYGAAITPEAAPTKEGYTFSGWDEVPETMPDNDVTVSGTFSINNYKLIYKVDGEEYKSYEVEYGSAITPEVAPTKEHYSFSGWSEIPETMPAQDITVTGTFSLNKHKLIYKVDGADYKSYDVEYGAAITPEPAPTKDHYTFSGWSDIPETMPDNDVTVTGTLSADKFKLIYKVDGADYKSFDVEYGAAITPEATPTKEGYTFSGWSEIPETMPAKDVTVTGTFSTNVIEEEEGEFEVTSENTVEIIDDDNVSGAYSIPESISHNGVSYSVTSIGDGAFMGNTNLTDITIPSSITSIGSSAFSGCSNLKTITVNIEKPISLTTEAGVRGGTRSTSSVFEGVDLTTCILFVPEGSVDAYKAAPVWKEFVNILAIGTTGINGIVVSNGEAFDVFSISGQKVKAKATSLDGLPKGIYVINGQKILKK